MAKISNIKKIDLYRLAEVGRTIPKQLHGCTGADFNKPHVLLEVNGRFTVNQIKKAVEAEGFDFNRGIDLQIMQRNNWSRQRYNLATVNLNYVNIDYRPAWTPHDNGEAYLDNYWRKSDFDEQRKNENGHALIFAQYIADLTPEKPKTGYYNKPENGTRYKVKKVNYKRCNGREYITEIEAQAMAGTGKNYRFNVPFTPAADPVGVEAYFDKNGYYIYNKRDELQTAAQKLRAERQKAAYKQTNNAAQLQALAAKIDNLKQSLAAAVLQIKTAADAAAVADCMKYYNGFEGVVKDFEELQKKDAAKEYRNQKIFTDEAHYIDMKIFKIFENLIMNNLLEEV